MTDFGLNDAITIDATRLAALRWHGLIDPPSEPTDSMPIVIVDANEHYPSNDELRQTI